jgi:DNA invertase Pin-like site-specific DNA recombinase
MSLKKKPPKRLIGYARVSTQSQDLARQLKALKRAGCARIYSDTASGKTLAGRPELAAALDALDRGDELVIAEWDRATRSMWDGLQIIKAVIDAGAVIKVLDRNYIDLTTPMGRGFMAMMSAMAEDERLRIIKRTHEGRQIARANGVKMGRKPILTPYQTKEARQRIAKGEKTREVAKTRYLPRSPWGARLRGPAKAADRSLRRCCAQ